MEITTERFGRIEIGEEEIIGFGSGLPAFEGVRRFVVLRPAAAAPFAWLQAVDRGDLAFLLLEPWAFCADYDLDIGEGDCRGIDLASPEEAEVYAILTARGSMSEMTANLLAPVAINRRTRRGKQVINNLPHYTIRHPVLAEMNRSLVPGKPVRPVPAAAHLSQRLRLPQAR